MPALKAASRTIAVASVGALALASCAAPRGGDQVDFGPRTGWRARGLVGVRADGRISLRADGRGLVWKPVELDVDRFPILLVRTSQSFPRFRWTILVAAGDSAAPEVGRAVPLLAKTAEEGGWIVPLQRLTGWSGKVRFVLMILLEGRRRDWVEFGDLEAVRLTAARPAAPGLSGPASGAALSPEALHYSWRQVANAVDYELQVSSRPEFFGSSTVRVSQPYLADLLPYLPPDEELLHPGSWFWRVRALNVAGQAGDWSRTGRFTVREGAARSRPPELSISAAHPLIVLIPTRRRLEENWTSVPEELRPHVVFRVEELPAESLEALLLRAQRRGVPVVIQASGPHDYYGRVSSRIPLSRIERIFQRFPVVKGVYICEQAFRVAPATNRIMMSYAERLIPLAARYRKVVLWADGHWGRNLWIDVGLNRRLVEVMRSHSPFVVPLWKMNGSLTPYSAHDAAMGFWVAGAVDNWGVQPERWYWYEAGFAELDRQLWFKEGSTADFPATFYGQMVLLGLSAGASVYAFEPGDDIWGAEGGLSDIAQKVIFPLLGEIIRQRWIPAREQVLRRVHGVYVADSADSRWALDYGTMHAVYEGAYGIEHPFQIIPSLTSHYRIPILSPWTPAAVLGSFPGRLTAGQFASGEAVRRHLDSRYPARRGGASDGGGAWVGWLDGAVAVMNSHENRDVDQAFSVDLGQAGGTEGLAGAGTTEGIVRRMTGRIGVHGYLLAGEAGGEFRMQVAGRPGRIQVVDLWTTRTPRRIVVTPPGALARSAWDPTERRLSLELSLSGSAVQVRIAS